jgi:hypothetical protein
VAPISHCLWTNHFNSDRGVLGRTIVLHEEPFTVVGVMPPGFAFETDSDVANGQDGLACSSGQERGTREPARHPAEASGHGTPLRQYICIDTSAGAD